MPVPTHGPDCKTHIWRTNCPDCKKSVWYFSCSCGSRVFFDTKGYPWREHADSCPMYNIRMAIEDGSRPSHIRKVLEAEAISRKNKVPESVLEYVAGWEKDLETGRPVVKEVLPADEPYEITGTIIKIGRVNFYHRFGINENMITRAILGSLAKEPYLEVVIQEEPLERSIVHKCRFYVSEEELKALKLIEGKKAYVYLKFRDITGDDDQAIWVAEVIDRA